MKKKTLAIYADSHGVNNTGGVDDSDFPKDMQPSWFEYLMNDYDITNYSLRGSSTYYSFNNFLHKHHLYDNVIFIPSSPGRIDIVLEDNSLTSVIPNFNLLEECYSRYNPNSLDFKKTKTAVDYMTYLYDPIKELRLNNCMIREVMRIRPDVLIIPAFKSNIWHQQAVVLSDFSRNELLSYKLVIKNQGYFDLRKCHLSEEHNEILYKKVKKSLENNDKFAYFIESDFVLPKNNFEYYFKKLPSGQMGNVRF